jgi:putative tricarboxylic transport membrane protein
MKFNDAVLGVFFVIFAIAVISYAQLTFPPLHGQNFDSRDFPTVIGIGFIACGVLLIFSGLKSRATGSFVGATFLSLGDWMTNHRIVLNFASVVLGVLLFMIFLNFAGFSLTSFFLLLVLFQRFGNSLFMSLISSAVTTAAVYLLFGTLLRVPLPIGVLGL